MDTREVSATRLRRSTLDLRRSTPSYAGDMILARLDRALVGLKAVRKVGKAG